MVGFGAGPEPAEMAASPLPPPITTPLSFHGAGAGGNVCPAHSGQQLRDTILFVSHWWFQKKTSLYLLLGYIKVALRKMEKGGEQQQVVGNGMQKHSKGHCEQGWLGVCHRGLERHLHFPSMCFTP